MANAVGALVHPDDPPWLKLIAADLGLKEVAGARANPRIVAMFQTVDRPDVTDDETSWCAACVGHYLVEGGVARAALPPKAERLLARSYLKFGHSCDGLRRGAIAVFKSGNASWQGHVAFVLRTVAIDGRLYVECIGGNQSNAITVARYPAETVLGYRWPDDPQLPRDLPPAPPANDPGKVATTAASGTLVALGTGAVAAAGVGVPWWAILAGAALGALGAGLLIFFLHKRG